MVDSDKKRGEQFIHFDRENKKILFEVEKRYLKRIPVDRDIYAGTSEHNLTPARLLNLSGSGALIQVALRLAVDQILELRVEEDKPIFARVLVSRLAEPGKSYGVVWKDFFIDQLPKGFVVQARI